MIIHRPNEVRTYSFDFHLLPEFVAGDSLTGVPTIAIDVAGPTLSAPAISGLNLVLVTVGPGGVDGQKYKLSCKCGTVGGSTLEIEGELLISTRTLT
jgi:hypothetical protein